MRYSKAWIPQRIIDMDIIWFDSIRIDSIWYDLNQINIHYGMRYFVFSLRVLGTVLFVLFQDVFHTYKKNITSSFIHINREIVLYIHDSEQFGVCFNLEENWNSTENIKKISIEFGGNVFWWVECSQIQKYMHTWKFQCQKKKKHLHYVIYGTEISNSSHMENVFRICYINMCIYLKGIGRKWL